MSVCLSVVRLSVCRETLVFSVVGASEQLTGALSSFHDDDDDDDDVSPMSNVQCWYCTEMVVHPVHRKVSQKDFLL